MAHRETPSGYSEVFELGHESRLPREEEGHRVVERFAITNVGRRHEKAFGTARTQTFDEVQEPEPAAHADSRRYSGRVNPAPTRARNTSAARLITIGAGRERGVSDRDFALRVDRFWSTKNLTDSD